MSIADSGFYVIEAENDAGLTDKEIEINVKGKTWSLSFCLVYYWPKAFIDFSFLKDFFRICFFTNSYICFKLFFTLDALKKPKVAPPAPASKPKPKAQKVLTEDLKTDSKTSQKGREASHMEDDKEIKSPVINANITDDFLEFESGSTFELSFEIDANSPTEINLYKDEEIIEAGDKHIKIIKERNIVKLKIDELSPDDSGFYVIEAENEAGLVEKEIEVNVKGNMGY